jgi:hypothetical protein
MKLLIALGLLAQIEPVPIACTPDAPLTQQQQIAAPQFDAYGDGRVLRAGDNYTSIIDEARQINDTASTVRKRQSCDYPIIAIGRVTARRFALTPSKQMTFGEYDIWITRVLRHVILTPDTSQHVAEQSTIQVLRPGGPVCTPEGRIDARITNLPVLELNHSYLLLLRPIAGGGFSAQASGYTLKRGQLTNPASPDEPGFSLSTFLTEIAECE